MSGPHSQLIEENINYSHSLFFNSEPNQYTLFFDFLLFLIEYVKVAKSITKTSRQEVPVNFVLFLIEYTETTKLIETSKRLGFEPIAFGDGVFYKVRSMV